MTISKALKRLKKLKNEASSLASKLQKHNRSIRDGSKNLYDMETMIKEYRSVTQEIVSLKFSIMQSNVLSGMYREVLLSGELKGLKSVLKSIDTSEGCELSYGGTEVNYEVQIDELQMDGILKEIDDEIEGIFDDLDTYNATAELKL